MYLIKTNTSAAISGDPSGAASVFYPLLASQMIEYSQSREDCPDDVHEITKTSDSGSLLGTITVAPESVCGPGGWIV